MNTEAIQSLVTMLERSSLSHMEYRDADMQLVLSKNAPSTGVVSGAAAAAPVISGGVQAAAAAAAVATTAPLPAEADNLITVRSPIVGTLYRAREPGADPFVTAGQAVQKGDVLCLIEAMKMFSEVTAPTDGFVRDVLFADGDLAEHDMPLITIGPAV